MTAKTSNTKAHKGVDIETSEKVIRGVRITNGRTESGDKVTYYRRERPCKDTGRSKKG